MLTTQPYHADVMFHIKRLAATNPLSPARSHAYWIHPIEQFWIRVQIHDRSASGSLIFPCIHFVTERMCVEREVTVISHRDTIVIVIPRQINRRSYTNRRSRRWTTRTSISYKFYALQTLIACDSLPRTAPLSWYHNIIRRLTRRCGPPRGVSGT